MNNKKNKKTIIITGIITGILVLSLLFVFSSCKKRELKNYNVVLVVIDTLRSDHLPFYGYKKNTAPFLSKLAEKAVVFENAFSVSSWTSPATASIFTSLYPFQHQVLMGLLAIRMAQQLDPNMEINKIPPEITTITEVMKKAGYRTFGVSDNLNIGERQGFNQGFDKFVCNMYHKAPAVNKTLKAWKEEITGSGKYFLYIHYMDPHAPYHQREPWYEPKEDRQEHLISAYDSEINFVDQHFEEMFNLFGWDKNTLLVVTADHGEGLWDHGKMGHGNTLYREELQVPLMIYLPEPPQNLAQRPAPLVSTIDILPTVRDIIGLPGSKHDEGVSLVPLMEGKDENFKDRYLFPYLWKRVKKVVEFKSTIFQKWQFVFTRPKKRELFNLIGDKLEQHNHYFKGYDIARGLENRFNEFMKESRKYKKKSSKIQLDKDNLEKLKSLGYVDDDDDDDN